jgi:hypothetical protein
MNIIYNQYVNYFDCHNTEEALTTIRPSVRKQTEDLQYLAQLEVNSPYAPTV